MRESQLQQEDPIDRYQVRITAAHSHAANVLLFRFRQLLFLSENMQVIYILCEVGFLLALSVDFYH